MAWLRGRATIQGITVDVDIVDSGRNTVQPPACVTADNFLQHPFASLPVDQDCNGIADSWESPFIPIASANSVTCGGPPMLGFTGSEDIEPPGALVANGPLMCGKNSGDGLTVMDEYRGFHTYIRNPAGGGWSVQWVSTNPVSVQDVFFLADWAWPDGTFVADSVNGPGAILARETPFIQYHRVQDPYAGSGGRANVDGSRNPIQLGRSNSATPRAYVVEYVAGGANGGTLGDGQMIGNTGKFPITIYQMGIDATATAVGLQVRALRDEVVAHETGHRLDLLHPVRDNCCTLAPFGQRGTLDLQHFTFDTTRPTRLFYLRYQVYGFGVSRGVPPVTIPVRQIADKLTVFGISANTPYGRAAVPAYDADSDGVYSITNAAVAIPACTTTIRIWNQTRTLMDWMPRLTMLRPPAASPATDMRVGWHFAASDLALLCITPVCLAQPPAVPPPCQ